MYLENIIVKNIGSIELLKLKKEKLFLENGDPKPIIIIGENGSGKTSLLSIITDALIMLASTAFTDVLPHHGDGKPYYRLSGGHCRRINTESSLSYIDFKIKQERFEYIERNGEIDNQACKSITDDLLTLDINAQQESVNIKRNTDTSKSKLFKENFYLGAHCFFPSDRFEYPHWYNREVNIGHITIHDHKKISDTLNKPIIYTCSLDDLKSWILDVILDSRQDIIIKESEAGQLTAQIEKELNEIVLLQACKQNIETILSKIMSNRVKLNTNIRGRGSSRLKIDDAKTNKVTIPSLDNLSAGQSTLFCIFASIIKSADQGITALQEITGIVIIDEADLHLHIELQKNILPELIALFPKIQFIMSTHSPFLLYGMNNKFGANSCILNMPNGDLINSYDDFNEFEVAYNVFKDLTASYKERFIALEKKIQDNDKPLILCEGITDVNYLKKANEFLEILDGSIQIDQVGTQNTNNNGTDNGGTGALNNAQGFLRAKPNIFNNKIVLLYDCDFKSTTDDKKFNEDISDKLFVRRIPKIEEHPITKGIENLFSTETMEKLYENQLAIRHTHTTDDKSSGNDEKINTTYELKNKSRTQEWLCGTNGTKNDFLHFSDILQRLKSVLTETK